MKNIHKYSIGGTVATGLSAAAPFITQGNHTALGDIAMGLGTAATAIPVVGQWLGPALVAAGAFGNAAFGSNVNQPGVDSTVKQISNLNRYQYDAKDNANLLNQLSFTPTVNINKKNLGTQGWFSHKIDNIYDDLQSTNAAAMVGIGRKQSDLVTKVDKSNDAAIANNYAVGYSSAFGGPLFDFGDGAIAYDMAKDSFIAKQLANQNKNIPQVPNAFGFGGPRFSKGLKFPIYDNGIITIGAGGTHGENPFGGVLMGMAPDGQPNLVEEGEVIYNDYVYSNRLKVPKKLREKYHLNEGTFADAMNHYFKKNGVEERPNDPIMKNGLMAFASDLAMSQEEIKMRKEMKQMGLMADGGHLFSGEEPGSSYIKYDKSKGTGTPNDYFNQLYAEDSDYMRALRWLQQHDAERAALIGKINNRGYDNAATGEFINNFNVNEDNWYRLAHDYKKGPVHNAVLDWVEKNRRLWDVLPEVNMRYNGDVTNKTFGPDNTPANTLLGTITDIDTTRRGAMGEHYGSLPIDRLYGSNASNVLEDINLSERAARQKARAVAQGTLLDDEPTVAHGASRFLDNAGLFANLAGLAYNMFDPYRPGVIDEVGPFNPITASPIGDYVDRYHTDTNYIGNQLAQEAAATRNAIMQSTLPSRIGGLLAADYNAQVARGNAIRDAGIADYETNLKGSEFNRGTNQYNSQLGFNVAQANMQGALQNAAQRMQQRAYNVSNYDRYKMGRDQAIGQDLTAIGDWFDALRREGVAERGLGVFASTMPQGNKATDEHIGLFGKNGGLLTKSKRRK